MPIGDYDLKPTKQQQQQKHGLQKWSYFGQYCAIFKTFLKQNSLKNNSFFIILLGAFVGWLLVKHYIHYNAVLQTQLS